MCLLQPYPNDEDVELMSKDPNAYIHAHAEVERLKEEEKKEESPRNYDDQYHRGGRKKPVKVVSDISGKSEQTRGLLLLNFLEISKSEY